MISASAGVVPPPVTEAVGGEWLTGATAAFVVYHHDGDMEEVANEPGATELEREGFRVMREQIEREANGANL